MDSTSEADLIEGIVDNIVEGDERNEDDFYATPEKVAWHIVKRAALDYPRPEYIIEPSAGNGVFIRMAKLFWPGVKVYAVELREEERENLYASGADGVFIGDWVTYARTYPIPGRPLVLGNPPFKYAGLHIQTALDCLNIGSTISLLLKMNFLGGKKRARTFWPQTQFRGFIPIVPRPSFKTTSKASTDMNEYAQYHWEVGYAGVGEVLLPHIVWKQDREKQTR